MSRNLPDWLSAYLEYTRNTEPPTSYHVWCGLSVIAGALQRKVHLRQGFETIYPNLFVVLVGPSGRTRKGVALGIAKSMILNVPGVSVAPESTSGREAIILAMKRVNTNFMDPTDGKIKFHCSLTAFSEELSVFLGQGDIKLLANATDWYDSKSDWAYETIGRGRDSLQGLCFNLMGATAPEWIQSMLPHEAVGGGFTARVIFIVEEHKGKTVPEHELTKQEYALEEALTQDLERISQLCGEITFGPEARKAYTDWYSEQDRLLSKGKPAVEDPRFASYCERRATHLRKLMIILSASRCDSLLIEVEDFQRARITLEGAEVNMGKTFGGLGKAKYSDVTEQVKDYIQKMGTTTRSALMIKFYRDVDNVTLKNIEEVLMQMGHLKIKLLPKSGEKVYQWVERKQNDDKD